MDTENIFKIVIVLFIIYILFKINREKFVDTVTDIDRVKSMIDIIYQEDLSSIRKLSNIADGLNNNPNGTTVVGNTKFSGIISTNGLNPNDMPTGWSGGIRTRDIFADGIILCGTLNNGVLNSSYASMNRDGNITCNSLNVSTASISNTGNISCNDISCSSINGTSITSTNITGTNINILSDYRIKDNVTEVLNSDNFDKLRPVTYFNKINNKNEIGFIAHELQELYPELVSGIKDDDNYQSVNYIGLIPLLVSEIKELKLINCEFREQINMLEEKINI